MSGTFDANRRLAEIALWADGGARWVDRVTEAARATSPHRRHVTITLDRAELDSFVSGFQGIARALMGLAQPVPPPIPTGTQRPRLGLVR